MKRIGYLFEKITAFDNLQHAARSTLIGKKYKKEGAWFYFHLENLLIQLQEELITGKYQLGPYRVFPIRDPKPRMIAAAPLRDRVVHHALCRIIGPILERSLIYDTYACRLGRGTHAAVARAQSFCRGASYYLKCDIRKYFASIRHDVLKNMLARLIKDARVLVLLEKIIDHCLPGAEPGVGLPIGNLTSQYFANLYLGRLDHFIKEKLRIKSYVRYMDDFILFAGEKEWLRGALLEIREFLDAHLRLRLKEKAVFLAPVNQGAPFLGFQIFPGTLRLNRAKWARFQKTVRRLERAYLAGFLEEELLGARVESMIGHIQHADTLFARKTFFMGSCQLG